MTSIAEQGYQLEHPSAEIIWARAVEVFGDEEKARHWMQTTLPILDHHAPEEYAQSGDAGKQREVLGVLGAIDWGMFS